MSPYLFAIGMEYLTRQFQQLKRNPNFNFHPKCEKLGITHLMFARGDECSIKLMFSAFTHFSEASGLSTNLDKSNLFFCGVDEVCNS